jgi:hypothetical protein
LPIPFSMDFTRTSSGMPCPIPMLIATRTKAIKALSLKKTIRRNKSKIPRETTTNGMDI